MNVERERERREGGGRCESEMEKEGKVKETYERYEEKEYG